MELENEKRASILSDALPYIQQYSNKVVVVKYGGNAMTNDRLKQAVMSDLVLLSLCGIKIVLVHGGGPEINAMLKKVGKESKFVNGLRYTDEETINIVQMVLCGKVNKDLVDLLYSHKGRAVGLCGLDDHMIEAEQLDPDLGLVGEVTEVDTTLINTLLDNDFVPVISTVGVDEEGNSYNVNADYAAVAVAGALNAEKLVFITDVAGVMRDVNDPNSVISTTNTAEINELIADGTIAGGMIPKVQCCLAGVNAGVKNVHILDGRIAHCLILEIFTNKGIGTLIEK